MYIINRYFNDLDYETKKDLVSVGAFGIMNAIDNYQSDRGLFSTLASKCIRRVIIDYLIKEQKHQGLVSLEGIIKVEKEGKDLSLKETIKDPNNLVDILEDEEQNNQIKKIMLEVIKTLSERDKEIAILYFGIGIRYHEQVEIAEELGITRQAVSLRVKRIVSKISTSLQQAGIIENNVSVKGRSKNDIIGACDIDKCAKTLSEYLSDSDGELKETTMAVIEKFPLVRKEVSLMYFGIRDRKYTLDEIVARLGINYNKALDFIRRSTEDLILQLEGLGFINVDFVSGNIKSSVKTISK